MQWEYFALKHQELILSVLFLSVKTKFSIHNQAKKKVKQIRLLDKVAGKDEVHFKSFPL